MRRRFLAVVAAAVVAISGLTIPAAYADTDPSPVPTSAEEAGLPLAPEEVTEPADHPTSGGAETTSEPASTPGQPDAEQAAPAEGESAPELTPAVEEPEPASSEEAMEEVPAEEPQIASLMATRADTEAPSIAVQGSGVELLVTRTATGTGHGTIAQCGINSNNPDVFPDGNQAGAPADDSPYDEYACGRDSIQYQVELNFGQDAIPAARTVTFSFDISDQGVSKRQLRLTSDMQRMCSSSVPGVYSGSTRVGGDPLSSVTCTLNVEAGVSGSILLPPINIEAVPNDPFSKHLHPTLTFEGVEHAVPGVTILSLPQVDATMKFAKPAANATQTPNPALVIVDGVPGLVIAAAQDVSNSSFDPLEWEKFKGVSMRTTTVMDYTVGLYVEGDDVDSPRPLPEGAVVLAPASTIAAGSVFTDIEGNVITPRAQTVGSLPMRVGLWLPIETIVELGGFGLWTHAEAHSITDELGNPNYGREDAWDPGTGEACSFSTRSLGVLTTEIEYARRVCWT